MHISTFEGASALSPFRRQALLQRIQALAPELNIVAVHARLLHFVASRSAPDAALHARLAALLRYGPDYDGGGDGASLLVLPRLGTISPWASKATDIAHSCGADVLRIERGVEYRFAQRAAGLLRAAPRLDDAALARLAPLLHDRMTETVVAAREDAQRLFVEL